MDKIDGIWHQPNKQEYCGQQEAQQENYERLFCNRVAQIVTEALNMPWSARDTVVGLIETHLRPHLCHRGELLEQYLHSQLDILAAKVKRDLGVDQSVDINYNHATHAKFIAILEAAHADKQPEEVPGA